MGAVEWVKSFPESPGVYLMKDGKGAVIYVGKAVNLRERVISYLGSGGDDRYQVGSLMRRVRDIEYIEARSEKEALLLEYELIQRHHPRYNIMYRDDKSFLKIRISAGHDFPGIYLVRKTPRDGSLYFGPNPSASSCRQTAYIVIKYFRLRNCTDIFFKNRRRPCLQYEIGRCTAPCVGLTDKSGYKKQVEAAVMFLEGRRAELMAGMEGEMHKAAEGEDFERAAHLRDVIESIKRTISAEPDAAKGKDSLTTEAFPFTAAKPALKSIQSRLRLPTPPALIECADISNLSGKFAAGAIVAFKNGEPLKENYRRYKIRMKDEPDDYGMMREVITRRFAPAGDISSLPARCPDILLVDGGKGQLMMAMRVIDGLGVNIPVAAIAKGSGADQIFIPDRKNPVGFRKNDPGYLLLQKIRDEAHRFCISYYRKRHRKGIFLKG